MDFLSERWRGREKEWCGGKNTADDYKRYNDHGEGEDPKTSLSRISSCVGNVNLP